MSKPLPSRLRARLEAMNKHLYPAHLAYRADSQSFRFEYHRDGHSIRKALGVDLEMAYERALQLRRSLDGPSASIPVVSSRQITLEQWYERWSVERFSALAPKTVEGYSVAWKHLGSLHGLDLAQITSERVRTALDAISGNSAREHAGVFLSVLLKAAVKAGILSASPWSQGYKKRKRPVRILSPDKLAAVFKSASESARPMLALAGFLGLRREEIFGLKVRDVDLIRGLVTIERTRVWVSGKGVIEQPTTKTGEPRVLPLPAPVAEYLRPLLADSEPENYLFPTLRMDLPERLRAACRRAGIEADLTLHDLRHICGSNMMMSGGLAVAQAVLGHRDIGTTADVYGHLTAAHLARHLDDQSVMGKPGQNDGSLSNEMLKLMGEARLLSDHLARHRNPDVARLASLVLQILPKFAHEKKTATHKNS